MITPEALEEELKKEGVSVERGTYLPYALTISHLNYLGKLAAFSKGKFAVQDESSQLAVEVADINEGDFVLDVCAAPGGKTFHAADRLHGTGKVLSRDLTEYKTCLLYTSRCVSETAIIRHRNLMIFTAISDRWQKRTVM